MRQAAMCLVAFLLITVSSFSQSPPAPISIPSGLLQQLIRDDYRVKICVGEYPGGQADLAESLQAKHIDLNGDARPEYIIIGDDGPKHCLLGERTFPTWLYRRTPSGYELLLTDANDIKPLATSTNGYRDLDSFAALGAFEAVGVIYKFDGRRYRDCVIRHYAWQRNQWVLQSTENKCQFIMKSATPAGTRLRVVAIPQYIRPQHRAILQQWLATRPTWRPATISDALDGLTGQSRKFTLEAIRSHGRSYQPYYAVADFNRDGSEDFAVILIDKSRAAARWAVTIFNGPFNDNQNPTPAFYTERVSDGDWLLWKTGDQFGSRIILGAPDSDSGNVIRPRGRGYTIQ